MALRNRPRQNQVNGAPIGGVAGDLALEAGLACPHGEELLDERRSVSPRVDTVDEAGPPLRLGLYPGKPQAGAIHLQEANQSGKVVHLAGIGHHMSCKVSDPLGPKVGEPLQDRGEVLLEERDLGRLEQMPVAQLTAALRVEWTSIVGVTDAVNRDDQDLFARAWGRQVPWSEVFRPEEPSCAAPIACCCPFTRTSGWARGGPEGPGRIGPVRRVTRPWVGCHGVTGTRLQRPGTMPRERKALRLVLLTTSSFTRNQRSPCRLGHRSAGFNTILTAGTFLALARCLTREFGRPPVWAGLVAAAGAPNRSVRTSGWP